MKKILTDAMKINVLENAPAIIAVYDTEHNIIWANKAYREATGLEEEEIIGKKCWIAWRLDRQCQNCPVTSALETGLPAKTEMSREKQEHWTEAHGNWLIKAVPLRDEKGAIIGAIETAFEISKEEIAEKKRLNEAEEKFLAISENALDAIIMIDEEWRVTYCNPAAERIFGYSALEMTGKRIDDLFMPEEYREQFRKGFKVFRKTGTGPAVGKVVELTAKNKSGTRIPIELTVAPVKKQGKYWAVAIIRDISRRKKAEEKIHHQIKLLSTLYKTAENLAKDISPIEQAKHVVRTVVEDFGLTLAWLGKAEKDGSVRLLAHYPEDISYPKEITVRWDESPEGQGPTGRAIRTGLPQITQNILEDPFFKPWKDVALKQGGIASAASFPLIARGHTFGTLNLYSNQIGFFTEERINEIQTLANLSAAALENARLYEESLSRIQRITALRNIDMAITGSLDLRVVTKVALDEIIKQLNVDAAAILLLDPYTQTLEYLDARGFHFDEIKKARIPVGSGISGQAVQERKTIHIADLSRIDNQVFMQNDLVKKEGFVSYYATPLIAKGKILGVLEIFHRTAHQENSEWMDFLETLAGQVAIAIENAGLVDDILREHTELINAYNQTIEGWATALALKEEETADHSQRVTELTVRIARAMGMKEEELYYVRLGALLHDIGKIGVPDSILLKPGKLTDDEWKIMKKHPEYAFQMLSPIAYLSKAIDIPYCHHEKWDGTGYPRGLKGKQIPLSARIFAVVDVWDALTSDRPYRKAWPKDKAIEYIRSQSGSHFDPEVVDVFMKIINEDEKE
jgi:PAS domain S-box-containing protein/putative nucleotidyltransferase with HDIG domain